jgi:heterodisulfide reductase subunit A
MNSSVSNSPIKVGAVLVVGGGVGGIQASLDLAESGFKVFMVDIFPSIGGIMAQLDKTFPTNDCSMCILAPKMIESSRHPNITIFSYSEVKEVNGSIGNFTVKILTNSRYVNADKCTGCGQCVEKCPVKVPNEFDEELGLRKAIYFPFPQAVPKIATVDENRCLFLKKGVCRICEKFCEAQAIDFEQKSIEYEVNVGAIILASGVETFDAKLKVAYGYGRFLNVVTSIEFERLLSASGPFMGHIQRPSDGVAPKKIAFIQCVGSRDIDVGNGYCSSVCCMYATKEAIIAKEHMDTIDPTIFYSDLRAFGKDFDKYIERAKNEYGINFVRCLIPSVLEDSETKNLRISYQNEDGKYIEDDFDLVVLSVGLQPSDNVKVLAEKFGIELNKYGFCKTKTFSPVETSVSGIFVCGTFATPKDIPETVIQASAAATAARGLISSARGTLVNKKEYVEEMDKRDQVPRIGVFVCHCGVNIGGIVDVPSVADYAKSLPNVVYVKDNLYSCSSDTQEMIKETIKEHNLNRVVVASCSPRTHEPLFQETIREAGLNRYLFEMANIRDQCSWVHKDHPEAATEKAKDLVRVAVTKAQLLSPLEKLPLNVTRRGLVIGGGVSGMNAALALAREGFETYLVEKESELGGYARNLRYTLEGDDVQEYLSSLISDVQGNKLIYTFLEANIKGISGYVGNFKTTIIDLDGVERELKHGVVIVATGGVEYHPNEYFYGEDSRVITQSELERGLADGEFGEVENIVMIQCVGSRMEGRQYCSRVCCGDAVKNALRIKKVNPNANVYVLYRDVRTYGLAEDYYREARENWVTFIRYDEDRKPIVTRQVSGDGGDVLKVLVYDPTLGIQLPLDADLVVLSTAIVAPSGNVELAQKLKVPLNEDNFFLEAHVKLKPVDFATEGVFLCGMAHGPKSITESIAQAFAASSRAIIPMAKGQIQSEAITAHVDEEACIGCGLCISMCPYNAAEFVRTPDDKWVSKINEVLCKGCGACAVICPKMAIEMYHFKRDQILAQIRSSFIIPTEGEFEPKIIVFTCNWCSYAGADLAGVSRIQYPTNVRLIRLMCSGRVDPLFIFEALSSGVDGVLITGCHPGECHYISGNLWAEARYEVIKSWIKEIGLEPERLRLAWISASEGAKFAQVIKDMVIDMKKLGPNPLTKSMIVKEV